jgi:hypothetical protein
MADASRRRETMMKNHMVLLSATTLVLGMMAASAPAKAACFEDGIGCTDSQYIPKSALRALSCDSLWTVRNTIYNERGYCFRTARAKAVFSNEDCSVTSTSQLDFNNYEQTNINRIVAVEKSKGCR